MQSRTVSRTDLRKTRIATADPVALRDGEVRLRIDAFGLTSNNVTYGAFGDAMRYWDFFPTGEDGWGSVPVWGFADVEESKCAEVGIGERFYGYLPIAQSVVVQPIGVGERGFSDGAAHRRALHAVYNHYMRCSDGSGYRREQDAEFALLRPLFTTSFLIDDFLADNAFFGASAVLLSSASSKTAYGTAHFLAQRRPGPSAPRVVGLTSPGNLGFARELGCYDQVLDYASFASAWPATTPAVYVDFSGSAGLRRDVHAHLGDDLKYSLSVGGTHWNELGGAKGLPGPRPVLFFAPDRIRQRSGDWGAAGLQQRLADAWVGFVQRATERDRPWLEVVRGHGAAAIEAAWQALLDGTSSPRQGYFLSLQARAAA